MVVFNTGLLLSLDIIYPPFFAPLLSSILFAFCLLPRPFPLPVLKAPLKEDGKFSYVGFSYFFAEQKMKSKRGCTHYSVGTHQSLFLHTVLKPHSYLIFLSISTILFIFYL